MLRITDVQRDLPRLNQELNRLDEMDHTVRTLKGKLTELTKLLAQAEATSEKPTVNKLVFVWDGPNSKVTWAGGWLKDKKGRIIPVPAGERTGLSPSTVYWFAWNTAHQVMIANPSLEILHDLPNTEVICSLKTGTAAQSGNAGGGGTDPGGSGYGRGHYVFPE